MMSPLYLLSFGDVIDQINVLGKLVPSVEALITQLLALAIMYLIVRKYFYRPIKELVAKRKALVTKPMDEAEAKQKEIIAKLEEATKILEDARIEAQTYHEQTLTRALDEKEAILNQAKVEANQIKDDALLQIEQERRNVAEAVRHEIVEVAFTAARQVIDRELQSDDHKRLIEEFIEGVKN